MPKIDLINHSYTVGRYPEALKEFYEGITDSCRQINAGDLAGLTQFGVNKVILPPKSGTAMRHWHENEDEFVIIISGLATLVDNDGQHELSAGDCAAFKAGDKNGHAILNNSEDDVILFEIGSRAEREIVHYPVKDLKVDSEKIQGTRKITFTTKSGKIIFST